MSDKRLSDNRHSSSSPDPINSKISEPFTEYEVKITFQILVFSSALKAVLFLPHFEPTPAILDSVSFTSVVLVKGCSTEMCSNMRICLAVVQMENWLLIQC